MIIGQTLLSDDEGSLKTYYSPWFPRGGSGAEFVIEVLEGSSSYKITVSVETKNAEGTNTSGSAPNCVAVASFAAIVGTTPPTRGVLACGTDVSGTVIASSTTGLLELVRFKYVVEDSSGSGLQWVHFRMLNPSWIGDGA